MDKIVVQACKECLVLINKQIANWEKKKNLDKDAGEAPVVYYDGIGYYSEDELREAFGCDAFNMKTFDKLVEKLKEETDRIMNNEDRLVLDKKLKFFNYFKKELLDTMELEG